MGAPVVDLEIVDASTLPSSGVEGVVAFFGITEYGPIDKPLLISSWSEFVDNFGGYLDNSQFPLLCKRALDGGAVLLVGRTVHYDNITSKASIVGTKAIASKVVATPVVEVRASGTITVTAVGAVGDRINILVLGAGGLPVFIGSATTGASETVTTLAAKIVTAITASGTGYTATNVAGVVTVRAPIGTGATPNGYAFMCEVVGAITYTATSFATGVTAQSPVSITAEASTIGAWGNKLRMSAVNAVSGIANKYDLTFSLVGNDRVSYTLFDVPATPTATEIASYNALLPLVKINTLTTLSAFTSTTFTGGAEDKTLIREVDYIGDSSAGTGLHIFDGYTEAVKIAIPELADPLVDIALSSYVDMRKDMMALLRTPVGVSGQGALDYRKGTGAYSHSPVNSWRSMMFTGGLVITDPVTGVRKNITELGDIAYIATLKDNSTFPWFSLGGPIRGLIKNALDVVVNFGVPARTALWGQLSANGINAVIKDRTYGLVLWDNVTLGGDTLLRSANIAELLVYLYRTVIPLAKSKMFDPNDLVTWKAIYRKVETLMNYVQNNRGLYGWKYVGDQDAENISQATVNTAITRDQGIYIFRLYIKPVPGMREVEIKVIVTNSDVDYELVG
jgi:hypothetical protein